MEIDQLRYFLKACETNKITRAAEELGITQSALSRSIQKLEAELGQPVFERRGRSVALTEAGKLLRHRAEQALSILENAKSEITDDGESGQIRVGAIPTIAPYFLPGVLQPFADQFPAAAVMVRESTTEQLVKACNQGEIDLAILALPVPGKHLDSEKLFDEELLLVLPPSHLLTQKKTIRASDIEPQSFVLLDEAHCLTDSVLSFCRQRSFQPIEVEKTTQIAMVQELVSLGHGVSMIPAMAKKLDQSDRRVYRSIAGEKPTRTIAMVWNPYRFERRLLKRFKEHLRKTSAAS